MPIEPIRPKVLSQAARAAFEARCRLAQLDPANPWVGGYVDYEWDHLRHILMCVPAGLHGRKVLEFGCNVGALAIVCAALGAEVSAVDVSADYVDIARLNAQQYGLAGTSFHHIADGAALPFPDACFDVVICNSVLEYVDAARLAMVQREIDRIVAPGGLILVTGTSNRLWPVEVHSRKWMVNYLPRRFDGWFGRPMQRGVWPWSVRRGFGSRYRNLDMPAFDGIFVTSRRKIGTSAAYLRLLLLLALLMRVGPGLLPRNLFCLLRKQAIDDGRGC